MTFYLKPPRGLARLDETYNGVQRRLRFLGYLSACLCDQDIDELVRKCCIAKDSAYLIEGTVKDRTSHFVLRLISCGNPEFTDFVIESETRLFRYRYQHLNEREHKSLIRTTLRHIEEILQFAAEGSYVNFLKELKNVLLQLASEIESIRVRYEYVLELVSRRDVLLEDGVATVTPCKHNILLTELFKSTLIQGFVRSRNSDSFKLMKEDERLLAILSSIKTEFDDRVVGEHSKQNPNQIGVDDVEDETKYFPPCMKHLHSVLQNSHQLRHHSRIQYTLFLKDIGLSVTSALKFWRQEYSRPCNGGNDRWKSRRKRYEYGIRHLYGLEGSKRNYRGHCCRALQSDYSSGVDDGGCPFAKFEKNYLKQYLLDDGLPDSIVDAQIELSENGRWNDACSLYFETKLKPKNAKLQIFSSANTISCLPKNCNSECDTRKFLKGDEISTSQNSNSSTCSSEDILFASMKCSSCEEHYCCPSTNRFQKPASIYLSYKKLLNELSSVESCSSHFA
ncbi:Uncharacterised protein g7986 [Pycnogonum litorale]